MKHYNTDIAEEFSKKFNLKGESAPDEVDVLIANVEIQPRINVVVGATGSVSGALTSPYTTPLDRDFFITSITMGYAKDATCDIASNIMTFGITVNGKVGSLCQLPMLTLTAQSMTSTIPLPKPVKVDRGIALNTNSQTFTVGLCQRCFAITGYTQ